MRDELVVQTKLFMMRADSNKKIVKKNNSMSSFRSVKSGKEESKSIFLDFDSFKDWLNQYPFIRVLVRESMNPRLWTLQKIHSTSNKYTLPVALKEPSRANAYKESPAPPLAKESEPRESVK